MTIRAVGFDDLAKELSKMGDDLKEKIYPIVGEAAGQIQQEAKQRVPVEHGDLKDSIKIRGAKPNETPSRMKKIVLNSVIEADYPKSGRLIKKGTKKAAVGAKVYYAYAVEYGTKDQQEQPFLMPAFENAEEPFVDRISKKLEEIVDGNA